MKRDFDEIFDQRSFYRDEEKLNFKTIHTENERLLTAIENNAPALTKVNLFYLTAEQFDRLCAALTNNTHLKTLELADNSLEMPTLKTQKKDIPKLLDALQKNNHVTYLDLSNNVFDHVGIEAIGKTIKENKTLTKLKLDNLQEEIKLTTGQTKPRIIPAGIKLATAVETALPANNTLTSLSLVNNGFNVKSAQSIATGIEKNHHLKVLDLSENNLSEAGGTALANALRSNGGNKTLLVLKVTEKYIGGTSRMRPGAASEGEASAFLNEDYAPITEGLPTYAVKAALYRNNALDTIVNFVKTGDENQNKATNSVSKASTGLSTKIFSIFKKTPQSSTSSLPFKTPHSSAGTNHSKSGK